MMANPRKRPAPSASPTAMPQTFPDLSTIADPSELSNDQFMAWGANNAVPTFNDTDPSLFDLNADGLLMPQGTEMSNIQSTPAGQLVRRNLNRELTVRGRNDGQENWGGFGNGMHDGAFEEVEDGDDLEARAAAAKRDAQSRSPPKQIPPFIQKLSSFLDRSRNTDLIRWSDDGNSFIVLDEDRFANELIPELFKHNHYASFVRQLNMYGFHKKVGLSDNSMRSSEKKAKNPSEYINVYFKRGRPELLWLIQKPKNSSIGSKKKKGKAGEEDQDSGDEEIGGMGTDAGPLQSRSKELTAVSPRDFASMRQEIQDLKRSQQQITSILARLRDENNQYIRQASTMVSQAERHETSINAILTFLATFYNRSLEGHGNLAAMFGNHIPTPNQHGNVVDVGDYDEEIPMNRPSNLTPPSQARRRPLALLPAPATENNRPSETPSSRRASTTPYPSQGLNVPLQPNQVNQPSSRNFSAESTPPAAAPSPSNTEEIMSMIHNVNNAAAQQNNVSASNGRTTGPNFDFDSALKHYQHADGKTPLTAEQRDNVLSLIANTSGNSTPNLPSGAAFDFRNGGNPGMSTGNTPSAERPGGNNGENPYRANLERFWNNRTQLEMLQRLQEEQDAKMHDLAARLEPLSPNGEGIPGLTLPGSSNASMSGLSPGPAGTMGMGAANNDANANGSTFYGGNGSNGQSVDFDAFLNNFSDAPGDVDGYFGDGGAQFGPGDLEFPDFASTNGNGNGVGGDGTWPGLNGGEDDDLFGAEGIADADEHGDGDEEENINSGIATTPLPSGGGRVVGSVTTSSGAPSPSPAVSVKGGDMEDTHPAMSQTQVQGLAQGRSKRRMVGR